MDDKKFKEELSKFALWYIPIVKDGSSLGKEVKPRSNSNPNPTLGPVIEEMRPRMDTCEWCGIIGDTSAKNHTLKFTSIDGKRPKRRWEHSCGKCKKTWNPETGILKDRVKPKGKERVKAEAIEKAKTETAKTSTRRQWWNDPAVYTVSDKDKLG